MTLEKTGNRQFNFGRFAIWTAAACVVAGGVVRFIEAPSFWLDEAFIAVSLRNPSLHSIFARLEYAQFFPRIYLTAIAGVRELFGYHFWVLRLLPFVCFAIGTVLWARLLAKRAGTATAAGLLGALLLLGASYWLDQAAQLKQYTFEALLALVPFIASDGFFTETLAEGRGKRRLLAMAIPCLVSYTYPIALGARVAGWYLSSGMRRGWRLRASAVAALVSLVCAAFVVVSLTDHRFTLQDSAAHLAYWKDCILRSQISEGPVPALRLIARFLWGWQGRRALVTAAIMPLQIAGVYKIIRDFRKTGAEGDQSKGGSVGSGWGSRSIGSLVLLAGVLLASLVVNLPICGGRLTLFAQVHTQIPAIEGALLMLGSSKFRRWSATLLWAVVLVVAVYSTHDYVRFMRAEPAENLLPVVRLIDPREADVVWVHPCSVAQVRSLPDMLPVQRVLLGNNQSLPPPGEKVWIVWTHLGNESCVNKLDQVRGSAKSWQLVHEGPGRGLALAEF